MVTPLIIVAAIYILGIIFGYYCFIPLKFSLIALIVISFTTFILQYRNSKKDSVRVFVPSWFILTSIFLLGIVLCHINLYPVSQFHIKNFISPWKIEITGTVVEEPQTKEDRLSFLLKCDKYSPNFSNDTNSYPVRGTIKVSSLIETPSNLAESQNLNFTYGDKVSVFGRLQEPIAQHNPILFNYKTYLRNKGIFAVFSCDKIERLGKGDINAISRLAFKLKCFLENSIQRTISGEEAGLLKGVMVGDKEDITQDLNDAFVGTGLAHTLAVSGLHVGLVASIFYFFFRFLRLPKKFCALFNIPLIILYCLITGANPPAIRATILSVIMLSATLFERESDLLNSLAFAGLIILLINPLSLFDASFQLSFVATLGIIYLVPFFEKWLKPVLPQWIITPLSVSISAQVCVAPLIAYYFNKVSIVALIANLFIVPILGIILTLGFASAILSLVWFPLAKLVSIANFAFLWYFIQAIKFFNSFPFASLNVATPLLIFIAVYYLLIFAPQFKYGKQIFFSCFFALVVFIWSKVLITPDKNKLEVIFFDAGQGESIFVRFPFNKTLLIDGGTLNTGEYVLSSFLREQGIWKIDTVISTHSHSDHLGGLIPVIEEFKVGMVLTNESCNSSSLSNNFWQIVQDKKIKFDLLKCGDEIKIGDKFKIKVFNPWTHSFLEEDNNSLVLKLIYKDFEVLLPSDVRSNIQSDFAKNFSNMLDADILQVPHHGSAAGLNAGFIKVVKPEIAIIQLGRFNQFGFPGPEVVKTYEKMGVRVYRTDLDGAIQITTNGNTYTIKKYGGE